jgi:hypothetical protein
VHEYTFHADVDPATMRFVECRAAIGPLPFVECPSALASFTRLDGEPAEGLRRRVPNEFVGPSTCTHLNETMRSLEDVPALVAALRRCLVDRGGHGTDE